MDQFTESGTWEIDDQQIRTIRKQAGAFTFNLVKALLQTGYYSADHPLARAAAADIYSQFREVTRQTWDLTFVLVSTVDERGVMIDGLTPDPIEVARVFRGVMGDHFVTKFHEYFVRNRIASCTIKRNIEEADFEKFMSIWVSWAALSASGRVSATDQMSDQLNREGLLSVTVVGMDELLGARRHLPWSVKVALSRLRKDLSRLPMLKDASAETIGKLKGQVIEDVVRPLTKPDLIRDLLLDADLVCEGVSDITLDDVEDSMIRILQPLMVHHVAPRLLKYLERVSGDLKASDFPGRDIEETRKQVERVTRKVLVRLASMDFRDAQQTLIDAYESGLMALDEMPAELQKRIKATELVEVFKRSPRDYLNDFQSCTKRSRYLKFAEVFEIIVPELVEMKDVSSLSAFVSILQRHLMEKVPSFPDRAVHAAEIVNTLERTGAADGIVRLAVHTPREERGTLEDAMFLFGAKPAPTLIRTLAKSDDRSVRRAALDMLEKIGSNVAPLLASELSSRRHPWYVARNFIDLLGRIGNRESIDPIMQYATSSHVQVRESCMLAMASILGDDAGGLLMSFLEDEESILVRRALHALGSIPFMEPEFLFRLNEFIRPRARNEEEPELSVQTACMSVLARYEHDSLPDDGPDIEATLQSIIKPPRLKRGLPGQFGVTMKPDDLVTMAVRALGSVGGERSLIMLDKLAARGPDHLREAAALAAAAIRERPPPVVE